jgi:hypothetical protein
MLLLVNEDGGYHLLRVFATPGVSGVQLLSVHVDRELEQEWPGTAGDSLTREQDIPRSRATEPYSAM